MTARPTEPQKEAVRHARLFFPTSTCLCLLFITAAFASPLLTAQSAWATPLGQEAAPLTTPPSSEAAPAETRIIKGYTLPPEKYEQAVAYSRAQYRLYFIGVIYGLVVLLAVLGGRVAPKFRDWAERASSRRFIQAVVYVPLLMGTLGILGLPTAISGQWLALKYDQSVQGWGSWFWDWTKGQLIELVMSTFLIWLLYGVIRRSPRRWWFSFWLALLPILVFVIFIRPYVIDPLFFQFTPLEQTQPALVTQVEKVVERGGLEVPRERMFEMKASEKLKSVNAYVTGWGASQRIVVWDTIIEKMTTPQILFVFGHEMGHYVLGHIPRFIAFFWVVLLVFLYLGYRGMHWALERWGRRWAIRSVDDWASLPVLLLCFSLFLFLAAPLLNTHSRSVEHEADIYGLEVIHGVVPDSQQAAAEAFQVLGEIDLADPDPSPFIKVWLYDHPALNERILFAQSYDPWSQGRAPAFVK